MFRKILIANRGEIACRVMRTARSMGMECVAVFSDADRNALHVREADEAIHIGPAAANESYLRGERIIQAALDTGAEAIHPGYGFLSENPGFVEAVEKAGLAFIGPSSDAIRAMGLKDAAKKLMEEAGVPVVPGYHGDNQDAGFLAAEAEKIGYPVLIKARAGGGGKGMRLVEEPKGFIPALEGAVREGEASFGDGRVLVEKFITSPRHIEIQVFADSHGNVVHLFERDCSLQRRHQKVIEEAPAPGMTEAMRAAMGNAAVKAAKAINYSGAGTIEFIVDGSNGLQPDGFWFMEMNTRLQVEHPVTEAITGVDLVEWQLRVANGEALPLAQDELEISGHAFEARLYAEDVPKGFLPATGTLEWLEFSDRARNDSGVEEGDTITPFYDPMIAKVITHAATREEALAELEKALGETQIAGTVTNTAFLRALCVHGDFFSGKVDTGLIGRELDLLVEPQHLSDHIVALAAKRVMDLPLRPGEMQSADLHFADDAFDLLSGFTLWEPAIWTQKLVLGEAVYDVRVRASNNEWEWSIRQGDDDFGDWFTDLESDEVVLDTHEYGDRVAVFAPEGTFEFTVPNTLAGSGAGAMGEGTIVAPMPGLVKQVMAKAGDNVSEGDPVLILEAMKMEHTLTAPDDGKLDEVNVVAGDQVEDGAILAVMAEKEN